MENRIQRHSLGIKKIPHTALNVNALAISPNRKDVIKNFQRAILPNGKYQILHSLDSLQNLGLRLFPLAAFFRAEEGVDDFHVLDGVFDAPDGFLHFANDTAEGFGLQLVLVGYR